MNARSGLLVAMVVLASFAIAGCTRQPAAPPTASTGDTSTPTSLPSTAPSQPNPFLVASRGVLTGLFDGVRRDAALSPTGEPDVGVDRSDEGIPNDAWTNYPTKDEWVDVPSKLSPGFTASNGRVSIWLGARRDAATPPFTPFVAPKGCFVQRTVWETQGPVAKVMVYSMTGDAAAHDRLLAIVREELLKRNVTVK